MIIVWLLVSGGVGTLIRYWMSLCGSLLPEHAYIVTLGINVLGSFLFGVVYGLCDRFALMASYRAVLLPGFLGGFTTFSAYAGEVVVLILMQRYMAAALYVVLSNVVSFVALYGGLVGIRLFVK